MKFYYLVAAYNEEDVLARTIHDLAIIPERFPGSEVLILVNGSSDRTWQIAQTLSEENSNWVTSYHNTEKGMGVAFKRGLRELLEKRHLGTDDWIVFCASDLPFGFSDLESFLKMSSKDRQDNVLFVGSKSHPQSKVERNWKRKLGSKFFEIARRLILNIKTRDTQGSLFLRGEQVSIVEKLKSNDYFITAEIVYFAEKIGMVTEMPVHLRSEIRNSKISLIKDGCKSLLQLLKIRLDR